MREFLLEIGIDGFIIQKKTPERKMKEIYINLIPQSCSGSIISADFLFRGVL